jgi:manganese transport protein
VVLSLQLPFAVVPLIRMTGDRELMGRFANGTVTTAVAWGAAGIIIALNLTLILSTF